MRHVASRAAFDFYRFMFVNEWPSLVGVAFETNCVLGCCRTQLAIQEATMGIVTIGALDETFIYAMMKRPLKLLRDFLMAAIAKLRLLFFHQVLRFLGMVWRMAVRATHVVLQVGGACEIAVLFPVAMATQAAIADFLG